MRLDVGAATGVMDVVAPAIVVVEMISAWLSSSCSEGIGSKVAFDSSMDSPQSFKCQSTNVPLCSLTIESLTIIVQVPTPDSPLPKLVNPSRINIVDLYSPVNNGHESPILIS